MSPVWKLSLKQIHLSVCVCVCVYFLHQDVKMTGCEGLTRLRQRHKTIVLSGGPLKQMGP